MEYMIENDIIDNLDIDRMTDIAKRMICKFPTALELKDIKQTYASPSTKLINTKTGTAVMSVVDQSSKAVDKAWKSIKKWID